MTRAMKAAKTLGVTMRDSFLWRADKVIDQGAYSLARFCSSVLLGASLEQSTAAS